MKKYDILSNNVMGPGVGSVNVVGGGLSINMPDILDDNNIYWEIIMLADGTYGSL